MKNYYSSIWRLHANLLYLLLHHLDKYHFRLWTHHQSALLIPLITTPWSLVPKTTLSNHPQSWPCLPLPLPNPSLSSPMFPRPLRTLDGIKQCQKNLMLYSVMVLGISYLAPLIKILWVVSSQKQYLIEEREAGRIEIKNILEFQCSMKITSD